MQQDALQHDFIKLRDQALWLRQTVNTFNCPVRLRSGNRAGSEGIGQPDALIRASGTAAVPPGKRE